MSILQASTYPLPPETRVEVDLLGRPDGETLYRIYSKTHLEYGVNEALRRYKTALQQNFQTNSHVIPILFLYYEIIRISGP